MAAEQLAQEFRETLCCEWYPSKDLMRVADKIVAGQEHLLLQGRAERQRRLLTTINSKFHLNQERLQCLLDVAAQKKIFPNYHDKAELLECLDSSDAERFTCWLQKRDYASTLLELFTPITPSETLALLAGQLDCPTVKRSDAKNCDASERRECILRALFGSYIFHSLPQTVLHCHFNADCRKEYIPDFYQHLQKYHPQVLSRQCALIFAVLNETFATSQENNSSLDSILSLIAASYERLSNHGYLALLIKPFLNAGDGKQWELFSDIVLYAEKHREVQLKAGYFHPELIERTTKDYIGELNVARADFKTANEGFLYRDCIILPHRTVENHIVTTSEPVDLLLLFQKNERDETVIPCPACRSLNVRGNSYPTLGVRSWECQNPICPDRSAFDRGNRYSLEALIKQKAINSENDQIPETSLKTWKLDVVSARGEFDVAEMLLRHFSLHEDTATFINFPDIGSDVLGRCIRYESLPLHKETRDIHARFQQSCFFHRFLVDRQPSDVTPTYEFDTGLPIVRVLQGDCFEALTKLELNSFEGAITSPPYYNARSYSTWPNIYCYLYDMYNIGRQVYAVLKPGAYWLFNIFDYFDNENIIAWSAMGKKRMILGAYIINLFRRIGFELDGNTAWFKGEVEGKRNFNQGNRSPYYQLPLNAWEHIFIFHKPGTTAPQCSFPRILATKPVIKMKGGKNVLGHTAPFPSSIPDLLLNQLAAGANLLDPFSGSMTTGRAAYKHAMKSTSIELHSEYCKLGINLLRAENGLPTLYDSAKPIGGLFDDGSE